MFVFRGVCQFQLDIPFHIKGTKKPWELASSREDLQCVRYLSCRTRAGHLANHPYIIKQIITSLPNHKESMLNILTTHHKPPASHLYNVSHPIYIGNIHPRVPPRTMPPAMQHAGGVPSGWFSHWCLFVSFPHPDLKGNGNWWGGFLVANMPP